ncbi:hypothetical protein B0H13DRAFT_2369596 [Mycena leptocephala]|nr:hypothetical protein B0H13DRAFT_2369596 [Mycena leptocephala]
MRDFHLDWIWSRYNTSPDPASGMQSLYQTCSAFTKHVLQPSHIILRGGGFTLRLELAVPLTDIVTSMDRLLYLAAKHVQLHSAPCIGQQELRTLTITEGLHACATYNQVVYGWVTLIDRLARAMRELQWLCIGEDPSRHSWSSWMPGILASLPPSLRAKLPSNFLESYNITVLPPPANISDAASQKAAVRKRAESLSRNPMHCSHVSHSDVEAGGLASPEETKGSPRRRPETSEDVTSYVNKSTPDNRTGRAPGSPDPSNATATTAVDLVHTDRDASMSELVNKFTSYPTPAVSLLARITCIVKLKSLGSLEITDRGEDLDRVGPGRFGLERGFFRRVSNTLDEMQALLTRASSLVPGRTSCFLVDPHKFFTDTFRGTHDAIQLHNAWAALSDRMRAAQDAVEQYRREYRNVHEVSSDVYKESCKVELGPSSSVAQSRASSQGKDVHTASAVVTSGSSEPPAPQVKDTARVSFNPIEVGIAEIEGRTPGEQAHAPETAPALLTQASVFPPGVVCSARMASRVVETHEERPQVAFANASHLDIRADFTRGKSTEAGGRMESQSTTDEDCTFMQSDYAHAGASSSSPSVVKPSDELLGLHIERAESCATASTVERRGRESVNAVEMRADARWRAWQAAEARVAQSHTAAKASTHRLANILHQAMLSSTVGSGGQALIQSNDTSMLLSNQQSTLDEDDVRTSEHAGTDHNPSILLGTWVIPSSSTSPYPPARTLVVDFKKFVLVSAILRAQLFSHLAWILREQLVPHLEWEREGIGTRVRT